LHLEAADLSPRTVRGYTDDGALFGDREARRAIGQWRKSTYSDANGGDCAETASSDGVVLVRDTADRAGAMLCFTTGVWATFTDSLR